MTWLDEIVQRWIGKDLERGDVARMARVIRELMKVMRKEKVSVFGHNLSPDAKELLE